MEQASDFERILSLLSEDLTAVGLSFNTCGIDVLDEPMDQPSMAYFENHGFRYTTYTIDPEGQVTDQFYHVPVPFPEVIQETIERFIAGFTNMVLNRSGDALPDRQKGNLEKVLDAGNRLLGLIDDLLDLSKVEAGRMDVDVKKFSVDTLVRSCCAEVEPLVEQKPNVKLMCNIPENIGEAETGEGRVRQIVTNLLSNAIKFTERGEVAVRAQRDANDVIIAVSDTGTGIPQDSLGTIFEEFQQVKGSDTEHKGTGLGLPICKGFAELLGGSISVESAIDKGSTFTVRLPMVYGED